MVGNFLTGKKHLSENSHLPVEKPLQNFCQIFFRTKKPLFIARQKSVIFGTFFV
jgi:hypothetical protein